MSKLLRSNVSRMLRDKVFWLCILVMVAFGSYIPINQLFREDGAVLEWVELFMGYPIFLGILSAVFCSMFIGCDYSDGTIRNKIIVGHTRTEIYFANLLTQFFAMVLVTAAYFVTVAAVGLPILWKNSTFELLGAVPLYVFCSLVLMLAYASLHTMLSMAISNKTIVAVLALLLSFAMTGAAMVVSEMLEAPEEMPVYSLNSETQQIEEEMVPNSHYLNGEKRKLYEFYFNFLPTGQAFQLAWMSAERLFCLPLYSFLLAVITTGIGWTVFRRKDLK